MNMLSQSSGMMLCTVLGLTTLLASGSSTWSLWQWDGAPAEEAKPSFLPWSMLIAFGVASVVGAVLYPLPFAAVFG